MEWNVYEKALRDGCSQRLEWLFNEFNTIRTGRANPALLDGIKVEYFGALAPIKAMANIQIPEPRLLVVKPFEKDGVAAVVTAINKANIGLNPIADGGRVRIPIPAPTEESRKAMVKKIRDLGEQTKVQFRSVRQDVHKAFRADKDLTEDQQKAFEENLNRVIKELNAKVAEAVASKEKEVMTV